MADINLLPVEEKAQESFLQLQKKLSLASAVVLGVVAVFTVVTLLFFTSFSKQRAGLIADIEKSTSKINDLKAREELFVVVKAKAQSADSILAGRVDHVKILEEFSKLVPQGVYFTDMKFGQSKINFSGKGRSSADVAGLVSSLLSTEGSKLVSGISVDSLSSDETGVYVFAMSAQLAGLQQSDKQQ